MSAAVALLHPGPQPPKGLDAASAVNAAFAVADAYRQAELAGLADIARKTVFSLVDRYGADAVRFALEVSAQRSLDDASVLGRNGILVAFGAAI